MKRIKVISCIVSAIGFIILLLAACASDNGAELWQILPWGIIGELMLAVGIVFGGAASKSE